MKAIIIKEIKAFFNNNIGLIISAIFLLIFGTIQWTTIFQLSIVESGYSNMYTFFIISPPMFILYISSISMKSLSEEYKSGTIELLLTKPLKPFEIVLSKFLALFIIVLVTIISTLIYPLSLYFLGETVGNIDVGEVLGSYIGLIFTCSTFISISLFCSSTTSNQVNSLLLSIILNFLIFYGFTTLANYIDYSNINIFLNKIGAQYHYDLISKGVIVFSDIIYFISITILFLLFTEKNILKR